MPAKFPSHTSYGEWARKLRYALSEARVDDEWLRQFIFSVQRDMLQYAADDCAYKAEFYEEAGTQKKLPPGWATGALLCANGLRSMVAVPYEPPFNDGL